MFRKNGLKLLGIGTISAGGIIAPKLDEWSKQKYRQEQYGGSWNRSDYIPGLMTRLGCASNILQKPIPIPDHITDQFDRQLYGYLTEFLIVYGKYITKQTLNGGVYKLYDYDHYRDQIEYKKMKHRQLLEFYIAFYICHADGPEQNKRRLELVSDLCKRYGFDITIEHRYAGMDLDRYTWGDLEIKFIPIHD